MVSMVIPKQLLMVKYTSFPYLYQLPLLVFSFIETVRHCMLVCTIRKLCSSSNSSTENV